MSAGTITANGQSIAATLPCTIEEFLAAQGLPRSVVVEHNGEAVVEKLVTLQKWALALSSGHAGLE
jgi:sulfur carrier protein ThiS